MKTLFVVLVMTLSLSLTACNDQNDELNMLPHAQVMADTCTGWNGRFFSYTNCGGQECQGVSFGPFYQQTCTDPAPRSDDNSY
jgi:hypothetical protein